MYKSGYVAIVGCPNAGKSTLLNEILGEQVTIVSHKPQTTRHKITGIKHLKDGQMIFLDTPGIHKSEKLINQTIVETARASIANADIVLHVMIAGRELSEVDQEINQMAAQQNKIHVVAINKVDMMVKGKLLPQMAQINETFSAKEIFPLCAKKPEDVRLLVEVLEKYLPEGPKYYPDDQYTANDMRFLAAEMVREKATLLLHEEIPYALTVQVDKFESDPKITKIYATIVVERDGQKALVIGQKGKTLKRIGELARADMEKMIGTKVYLELFVKVVSGWSKSSFHLKEFGIKN